MAQSYLSSRSSGRSVVRAQWMGHRTFGFGCGPDRSRSRVRPARPRFSRRSVVEKLFHILLGGLMASVCPGGWPLRPGSLRPGGERSTKDCAHLHRKSDEPSPCIPFSRRRRLAGRSAAYAGAKVTVSFRIQREKDEIRQQRPLPYLTGAGKVAKLLGKLATLAPKMATLRGDFVNPEGHRWQPCRRLAKTQFSVLR